MKFTSDWARFPCCGGGVDCRDHDTRCTAPRASEARPTPPGGTELEQALAECVASMAPAMALPTDAAKRKAIPMVAGCLDYFPAALAAVAELSRVGNEQHNPGQPLHHARGKSTDHSDCIVRHLMDRGTVDTDGVRHSAKVAWRALALLQLELEQAGAPLARAAKVEDSTCCENPTHCPCPSCAPPRHCKSCGSIPAGGCADCR